MTENPDQLFRPAIAGALSADLPPEHFGRWVLHRAGIVNVWQYDRAEFAFAGGRVLLRGRNGAGKSKALEVLLPLLLDGDTRVIDSAGRDRTTVHWLMTDGREPGNHVGYVWLEMRFSGEDGSDRFITLGAGLKASTSTAGASSWFFITDRHRVGPEFALGPEMSVDKLRELIGTDAVTTVAVDYRRRVAVRLFGVSDETRYSNLLRLLRTLRDPNIGNKIEDNKLASVLSDSLPPPAEDALEKAADRFDALEQIREQLERIERTAKAMVTFMETYSGYARTAVHARVNAVLNAESGVRAAERRSKQAQERQTSAEAARDQAAEAVKQLRTAEETATRELDQLHNSDAYKQHLNLVERRQRVAEIGRAAKQAAETATSLTQTANSSAAGAAQTRSEADETVAEVRARHTPLTELAGAVGVDPAVIPAEGPDRIFAAVQVAAGRRRAAEQVAALARATDTANRAAAADDEQAARSEGEQSRRRDEANAARERWTVASAAWRAQVRTWLAATPTIPGAPPPATHGVETLLEDGGTDRAQLAEARVAAASYIAPLRTVARDAEAVAALAVSAAEQTRDSRRQEREQLAATEEATPPISRFRGHVRDPSGGAPLYELVEVRGDVDLRSRAGLEAALEASGLLDAWVTAEGVVVDPTTQDVILAHVPASLPANIPTLADLLVSDHPELTRTLRGIGLWAPDVGVASYPWISDNGSWSLGPLRGAWQKAEAEYLGARARRETRLRRLEELDRLCAADEQALDDARHVLDDASDARSALERHASGFPSGVAVSEVESELLSRSQVAAEADERYQQDREVASQARALAVQARADLSHAAARDSLPQDGEKLTQIIADARQLEQSLTAWGREWGKAAQAQVTAERQEAEAARLREQAQSAAARADAETERHQAEEQSLRSLEATVGASAGAVLADIERWERERAQARDRLPAADRHSQDAASAAGAAERDAATAAAAVQTAADNLTETERLLDTAVALPGVYAAAAGSSLEAEEQDLHGATLARALRDRLADGEPISDATVMNRFRDLEAGLAGGYDVIPDEQDGIKFFHVVDDGGRRPLPAVATSAVAEAERTAQRLVDREREVIERFLLGELGDELRERLLEAHDLVASANGALSSRRTSHGIGAHLDWRVNDDADGPARTAAELLVKQPRSAEDEAELRDALMTLIRTQREAEPEVGYLQHLRAALDYRNWHRFTVKVVDDARPGTLRNLSPRLGLSQGEQRVISYLALFAAASAYYDGIGVGCPRLLLLDDAFAKVDEPTHGSLLRLLVDLKLDFVITSERMWGCFPEVPRLEIYEALRDQATPGVALVHFHWDGRSRHLVGL